MSREDYLNMVECDFMVYSTMNDISTFKECIDSIINRMCDDFESRTCENCIYGIEYECEQYCGLLLEFNMKYCSKWKEKI